MALNFRIKTDSVFAILMLFYSIIAVSPLLLELNWKQSFSTLFVFLLSVSVAVYKNKKIKVEFFLFFSIYFFLCSVLALYWMEPRYALFPIFLLTAAILVYFSSINAIEKFCSIATYLILILLIGAIVAFFLAQKGVQPLFSIEDAAGRKDYFYYVTFTNSRIGDFIRPAGSFDEPGAFSFFICFVAAVRRLLNRREDLTLAILFMGFITFSLAHLFYFILHFLSYRFDFKFSIKIVSVIALIIFISFMSGLHLIIADRLLSRLEITESGELSGDNRSDAFFNAYDILTESPKVMLFGADESCVFNKDKCKKMFPVFDNNPLGPLAEGGIFFSFPYYIFLTLLLSSPIFGRRYFVVFGIGLLFLQRPYLLNISYSFVAVLIGHLFLRKARLRVCRSMNTQAAL